MMKKFFLVTTFSIFLTNLQALDLTDLESSLADVFSSSVDSTEGYTTFRSLNIPTGGRTEALGTAFTALADDSSFFDYNPAASSVLEETEISIFHNSWIADSALETISLTRRNGNLGYGGQLKCFYVPFSEYNLYGDRVAGSYYTETTATFNIAYNFFSGYSFKGIALGANGKLAWRGVPDYTDNQDNSIISGSGLEQSALGLMADAGLLMRFNLFKFYQDRKENLKFALSLNNIGLAITGFTSSIKKDDDTPARIAAGLYYKPFSRFAISVDVRKPILLSDLSAATAMSFAIGAEARITQLFSFQTGFLLQGSNPRFSMGSEFDIKGIKMDVAYTFDLTSSANPVNHISLSAKIKFGDRGRKEALKIVDSHYVSGLKSYANGDYDEAIVKWNEAIKLAASSPLFIKYEPAIEARKAAINFNRNQMELESLYSVISED